MALEHAFPVSFEDMFADGAWVPGDVEPVKDWDASSKEKMVQATVEVTDRATGEKRPMALWRATLQDSEGEQFPLNLVADVQPVLPKPVLAGLRPVVLEGLQLEPMVNRDRCKAPWGGRQHVCRAQVGLRFWAYGVTDPAESKGSAGSKAA